MTDPGSPALWVENAGAVYHARDYRAFFSALAEGTSGVFGPTDLQVVPTDPDSMDVTVLAGDVAVAATAGSLSGLYFQHVGSDVTVTIPDSDASNAKTCIVGVTVYDTEGAMGSDDPLVEVYEGPADGSLDDPALPDNVYVAARVTVDALASSIGESDIEDLRAYVWDQGRWVHLDRLTPSYYFRGYSGGTSLAGNTFTKLTGFTVEEDPDSCWNAANSRYVAAIAGVYSVDGMVSALSFNTPQGLMAVLYVNGVEAIDGTDVQNDLGGSKPFKSVVRDLMRLEAGDYIELYAYNRGGNSIAALTGTTATRLAVARL